MSPTIFHLETTKENDTLKERLITALIPTYFWWYQIGDEVYPFGNKIPTFQELSARIKTLPENYEAEFYKPVVTAIKYRGILSTSEYEENNHCYFGFRIGGVFHSLNGWRSSN